MIRGEQSRPSVLIVVAKGRPKNVPLYKGVILELGTYAVCNDQPDIDRKGRRNGSLRVKTSTGVT